ncbi:cytidylyltransferase domain-containing protein [Patescibacteria group bacterium]
MKVGAIIQARMGSSRLPGKVLLKIENKTVLGHIVARLRMCKKIDILVVATTTRKEDDLIEDYCKKKNLKFHRGLEEDVLARFYNTAKKFNLDIILRVTADDPFVDPDNIDEMINSHIKMDADLTYTKDMPLGCGLGMVVFNFSSLKKTYQKTKKTHPRYREHIDEYILNNPRKFKINVLNAKKNLKRPDYRLTLDTKKDLILIKKIFRRLYKGKPIKLKNVVQCLDNNLSMLKINSKVIQK